MTPVPLGRTYLDSNLFIYIAEASPRMAVAAAQVVAQAQSENHVPVTSEYAMAECLVGARKVRSPELEGYYLDYFARASFLEVHPVSRDILLAAARLAGDHALKLGDAIHVATALSTGCKSFATNDDRIRLPAGLQRVPLVITPPAGS